MKVMLELMLRNRGSVLLGKFWNHYPQYFASLVFMSVPYSPGGFDLGELRCCASMYSVADVW